MSVRVVRCEARRAIAGMPVQCADLPVGRVAGLVRRAGVAQLAEQLICNQQVAGSSPAASSAPWTQRHCLEGCRSGQSEQTVNLPAYAYGGSNPPPSTGPRAFTRYGGVTDHRRFVRHPQRPLVAPARRGGSSSVGRASAFQAECRGFEPRFPLRATRPTVDAKQLASQMPCPACQSVCGACRAYVAQSVEHFLGKEEVAGSIPVVGSGASAPPIGDVRCRLPASAAAGG